MAKQTSFRRNVLAAGGIALALSFLPLFASGAAADRIIDGPIHLGGADSYGVLGASAVTNTGPTVVSGDVGVSPQSSVTGFDGPPGGLIVDGTLHQTDAHAAQAQNDTTTAYDVAASLTPTSSGIAELNGLSLSPGVYSGGALVLSDNGALVLAGDAESVWVFQAASTLTIGSATSIIITGGASACNVFWQVGSSATLGISAQFQGTVLADQSITATTGATVTGRLLARTGAVTMDTNSVSAPRSCPPSGTPVDTTPPVITSGAFPPGAVGIPYDFTITATGSPSPTYTVTSGALPPGLSLDAVTGGISGTPTSPGESLFTVTAANGDSLEASEDYALIITDAGSPPGTGTGNAPTPPATVDTAR